MSTGFGYTGIVVATLAALSVPAAVAVATLLADITVGAESAARAPPAAAADGRSSPRPCCSARSGSSSSGTTRSPSGANEQGPRGGERHERHRPFAATLVTVTPLLYATIGEIICERAGVLNLGIEGTMYASAFVGFAITAATGSIGVGLLAAVVAGAPGRPAHGAAHGLARVNQHVAGIGTTLLLIGLSEFVNRLRFGGGTLTRSRRWTCSHRRALPRDVRPHLVAFAVVAPLAWWVLRSTGAGLRLRAVGENPRRRTRPGSMSPGRGMPPSSSAAR